MRIWLVLFSVLATVALAESTLSLQPSPPPCAATLSMSPATIVLGEDITYTWSFSGHQPTHVYISLSAGCKYNDDGPCKYHGSRTVLANESPYTWTTAGWDLDHSVSWGPSWPSLTGYIESADASGRDGGCWDYASVNGGVGNRTDTLGSGSTNTSIALGDRHSCALLTNGTMKCWGSNYYGQLGDGTYTDRTTPFCVTGGTQHSCAVLTNGTMKCWGRNNHGQLGDGTTTDSTTPVGVSGITTARSIALGDRHSCALLTDGTMKCWGSNYYGQLGDGTTNDRSTPVVVSGITNATSIALGDRHSCALLTNDTMKCWGSNYYGQLGDGSYVTVHPKPICRRHTQKIYQQILLLIHQQQRDLPPITRQVFNPPQIL